VTISSASLTPDPTTDVPRPLVGITSSELRRKEQFKAQPQGEPPQTELALGLWYLEAIERSGGLPVILVPAPTAQLRSLVGRLDGLVLSGGPDLEPATYGQHPHDRIGPTEPEVDEFELALCVAAIAEGKPVLGICRGMQVLNVALGGTLHQHLPDVLGGRIGHRQRKPGRVGTHPVAIAPDSRLARVIGDQPLVVNSFHHQAIDRLAPGLRAVAYAPDDVIEAVEGVGAEAVFGVQWHAESMISQPRQLALFEALVAFAGGDAATSDGLPALAASASGRSRAA
jgi:putative glutamine amidotransferase